MPDLPDMPDARRLGLSVDGWRYAIIAIIAFLTLVDLFAAQAILPSLVVKFGVSPSTMGVAVNASTFGMAAAGLAIALFGRNLDKRRGVWVSLAVLAAPTTALAFTDDIAVFAALRVVQGIFMAAAFTLTMAYLAEHFTQGRATAALAAYVTGNVASNVFGRMLSAAVADQLGLSVTFLTFAALNVCGAALAYVALKKTAEMMRVGQSARGAVMNFAAVFGNRELSPTFAIGFLILLVFIGTYTYVNFRLTGAAVGLSQMSLGFVYLVFIPSLVTTPLAGRVADRFGPGGGIAGTLGIAVVGILLCLPASLPVVLLGLALVAVGTFLAQAIATGHVGRSAGEHRSTASGIYLASYYAGGLAGSFAAGQVFVRLGWSATVWFLAAMLVLGMIAALGLRRPEAGAGMAGGSRSRASSAAAH